MHETKNLENRTLIVVIITAITMVVEIIVGYFSHSMALLADGLHMGTHTFALGLTFIAYFFIRKYANSDIFEHGSEKIGTLAAYTSSLFLGITGIWIIVESLTKIINPLPIHFSNAILIASIGLIINLISIYIMKDNHTHEHDHNYKSAYLHILADILTSVLAIFALLSGKFFNLWIFDPLVGILGGIVILKWAYGLINNTAKILLDMKSNSK